MDLHLNGKKALVTGASRGLGYATAEALAKEGVLLAINSRDQQAIEEAARKLQEVGNGKVVPLAGDVSDAQVSKQIVQQAAEKLGGLDILITNSGGPPTGKFEDFDDQTWEDAVELSFLSHVRLIRSALPYLRQSSSPSVLTVTSLTVKQPVPNLILSNSIRAATVGLTKSLALELGSDGIRFNSILPSWISTQRVHELMEYRAKVNNTTVEEEMDQQAQASPLGRMGKPEEFANVAVFLVSPVASYVTGVMFPVDGGMYKGTF